MLMLILSSLQDQKVSWHATPFEERLEKALSEKHIISQRYVKLFLLAVFPGTIIHYYYASYEHNIINAFSNELLFLLTGEM